MYLSMYKLNYLLNLFLYICLKCFYDLCLIILMVVEVYWKEVDSLVFYIYICKLVFNNFILK